MWGMGCHPTGMAMNFPETLETQAEDFREIGPVVIITSSRFWEDLASKIRVKIADAGFVKRKLFALGEKIGGAVVDRESKKELVPPTCNFFIKYSPEIVYRPLLDRVGCGQFELPSQAVIPSARMLFGSFVQKG